jgi:hypothetical protein
MSTKIDYRMELVAREDRADRVAETIRKCKGECQRADGAWYHGVFFGVLRILPICERYFDALQTGEDLLGVM